MVLMATSVAPIGGYPRPSLTQIAKRVCNTLRPTPLIPAHRTRVGVTWTRVAVTLLLDAAKVGVSNAGLYRPVTHFILAHRVPVPARALQSASRRFTSRFLIIAIVINCLDGISRWLPIRKRRRFIIWVPKVVHLPGHGASRGGNVREITERCTTPISTQAVSGDGYQVPGWGLQILPYIIVDDCLNSGEGS